MSEVQSGILPEHCRAAIWLEANLAGSLDELRQGCRTLCQQVAEFQGKFPDAHLGVVVAFGHDVWRELGAAGSAADLKNFTPLGKGLAPATQQDVLIHIMSLRHDVNFSVAQATLAAFGKTLSIVEEIHGFRWVEERDLSGFVDGTENPAGDGPRRDAAVINGGIDDGGSYVLAQRWEHNLPQFERMSTHEQEMVIGRTKADSVEIDPDERPVTSHVTRVDLKENGKGLKIVRQSLPYGTASGVHGLYFCSYAARLHSIEQQLLSMFGELDGKRDALLRFTKPVTGGYYFAPSLDVLKAL
ncbi:Dyp-type peroxidase [Shimwellia blattae]|uniref:Putative iron-dependent peroxidase n=1 Tax=Shimwellia blattae (strain ATCC 29907 / DSM 4481 / JCM 1650 / NBRC 105725 / CDC 9005-74) TaxID=630626 RepID=I2B6P9_SHIBC|nr:Dyp-type peroxidase [Shimwellia blattae]AFJ46203.1 putative iron-dependent peroxidase [Shimwellia blattae DSM 4481 = NBRC 105725]GAB81158.1 hypothetical protein YfeX [Shimwellia blattae DSM 4481 = NBRC 105725]VDY63670.1 Probable deferrochelatase/peroxidase YfeX [Shimwellia blattae]VEC21774.1 Probable deferrochelatase/peroxidase YfeX [Shimwellia blattae]